MKTIRLILAVTLTFLVWGGYAQSSDTAKMKKVKIHHSDLTQASKTDSVNADSTEYELIIIDPGFESYLATQPSKEFYSESYYKNWNIQYVTEWNNRYITQARTGLYESYIDYDSTVEYGLDLEYRLYHYFRFFEKKNGITLVPRGR